MYPTARGRARRVPCPMASRLWSSPDAVADEIPVFDPPSAPSVRDLRLLVITVSVYEPQPMITVDAVSHVV